MKWGEEEKQTGVGKESCQALAEPAHLLNPDGGQLGNQILPVNLHALGLAGRIHGRRQLGGSRKG